MTLPEDFLVLFLFKFAENYLQRPLTPEETQKLIETWAHAQSARHEQAQIHAEQLSQARNAAAETACQQIRKTVQAASSLAELRPANLPSAPYTDIQLVIAQIADALANLVQKEVGKCFERDFGALRQQLENALHAANSAQTTD
ncbi:hypothetical protein AGMMS50289_14440 [Betaproteobacteria bacterium]|nr:hypothetical protein AGMMS50289_14440 [Betaproteobacteria bacterium]